MSSLAIYCGPCSRLVTLEPDGDGKGSCPDCGAELEAPASADVFISYAREDTGRAMEVAALLGAAGISHWIDRDRIGLGKSFVAEIATGLVEAKVVVLILSSHSVRSPWVETEVTDAKGRNLPILPLMVERFEIPRPWRLLLAHHQWEEAFEETLTTRADRLIERVRVELLNHAARAAAESEPGQTTAAAAAPAPVEAAPLEGVDPRVSPYVGPRPFSSRMADRFYGRQHEAQALLRAVSRSRTVLVYAPSGAGKSSLLNTVITRCLEDQGMDVMLDARVGAALPARAPIDAIRNVFTYSAIYGLDKTAPPHPAARLADFLRSVGRRPGTRGRVLVLDQFEEIFTQHRERFEDRAGFFEEVIEALEYDPGLRIIFALRQEYLADVDPLADMLPEHLRLQRFVLNRLGLDGALEAIARPAERYAAFAPGVADKIVEQLNTITVTRSDGTVATKRGEFIEMVHLQIVCERLWRTLPAGITRIEMDHLERAAGEEKTIGEFVADALDAFYDETIENVANSEITRQRGEYPKELIRLGLMKFITPGATRTMVQRANGRTGRLPDWIVEQLENSHLLRAEQRGGHRWYELSHDRLAEPVSRQLDREVSSLLFASDLLNKMLEKTLAEHGSLAGHFEEHRDVLAECRPFHVQAGLFPDEAEFVFRASLAAGQDMEEWSRRLAEDYPEVRLDVLREALSSVSVAARRNAAALLGAEPVEELLDELVRLAIGDPEPAVRRAAAVSIARLDWPDLYGGLAAALDDPAIREGALEALSRVRIEADGLAPAPAFESHLAGMPGTLRRRIRRRARALRFREGLPVFPFVFVPAATFAAITAASFKWLPGMYNWAISQATPSAAMGVFHGLTAGIVWAGLITLGLTVHHVLFGREHGPRSMLRPFGAVLAGALAGLLSSAVVVWTVVGVFESGSLVTMGWIASQDLTGARFWGDLFVTRRFGWVYLITGTGLGVGMALVTNAVRASPGWAALVGGGTGGRREAGTGMSGLQDALRALSEIMRIVLPRAWPLPVAVGLASVVAFAVPALSDPATLAALGHDEEIKATAAHLVRGLIGDGLTQTIGAYFGLCGMALGLLVMRRGLTFEPRREHA